MYMMSLLTAIIFLFCFSKVLWDIAVEGFLIHENKASYSEITDCPKQDIMQIICGVLSLAACIGLLLVMAGQENQTLVNFVLTNKSVA